MGGRSSAFIYFTYDRKFIIKTLKKEEMKVLLAAQRDFNSHYAQCQDGFSYLAKIYGLYTLKDEMRASIHFAVLENIIPLEAEVMAVFDLKGCTRHRRTLTDSSITDISQLSPEIIYKDLDFDQTVGKLPILAIECQRLRRQLGSDVALLERLAVMDYSLLVAIVRSTSVTGPRVAQTAIAGTAVLIGVIDYLQQFNMKKKAELIWKRISVPRLMVMQTSCVNQHLYAERFLAYVEKVFELPKAEMRL
jgi:hypothetical protein